MEVETKNENFQNKNLIYDDRSSTLLKEKEDKIS